MSYNLPSVSPTAPTSSSNIGYCIYSSASQSGPVTVAANNTYNIASFSNIPVGIWLFYICVQFGTGGNNYVTTICLTATGISPSAGQSTPVTTITGAPAIQSVLMNTYNTGCVQFVVPITTPTTLYVAGYSAASIPYYPNYGQPLAIKIG